MSNNATVIDLAIKLSNLVRSCIVPGTSEPAGAVYKHPGRHGYWQN